jgi:3-deoxy-manno-octulosonate cytidylyltransferase (CMP-KDO synthetase)
MIFNPLIVVASQLGIRSSTAKLQRDLDGEVPIMRTYRRVTEARLGSVIVDTADDEEAAVLAAEGAYTVRTDLDGLDKYHNYRSSSGAERIAATVNRFDRYYTHDIVVAVADDMPDLLPVYLQALMYALASTEVGIATLVSPLKEAQWEARENAKAIVTWNSDRIVHPLEGSRVGTLVDIRRDASALRDRECYGLVPIHAWRRAALDRLVKLSPSDREFDEGTDLVRALDARIRIDVSLVSDDMKILITPDELQGDAPDMGH